MKTLITILICTIISFQNFAQTNPAVNPFPKTISVTGSADMEIVPDEIYVNITLREYQKKGEDKKDLETIKAAFLENCKAANLPDSIISIESYNGYTDYYKFKKASQQRVRNIGMNDLIVYQINFNSVAQMDALIERLDEDATQSFSIVQLSHTKAKEYRKQLKIQAIKAAKEKGIYLTEAIGEKLGAAITIVEPQEDIANAKNAIDNMTLRSNIGYDPKKSTETFSDRFSGVGFKKIKYRYTVDVLFALQ
jgi:uncharacterized protein